jgi:Protein of unknown function (DUF3105)
MASQTKAKSAKTATSNRSQLLWYLWGGVGVLVIAGIIGFNMYKESGKPGEKFADQGNIHLDLGKEHPPYNSDPPTSGWHTSDLAAWGSYDYVVPDERFVHNLEDGGVILWYKLGTPEENEKNIAALEAVSKGNRHIVIAPRETMTTTYAMTAWSRLQRFDSLDETGMKAFIKAFHGIDHHVAGTG